MQTPINWLSLIFNVLICILAYIYAADLRKLRHEVTCSQVIVHRDIAAAQNYASPAPPYYLTQLSSPPPPYHPPPSYADSLVMAKNFPVHMYERANVLGTSVRRMSVLTAQELMASAPPWISPR